MPAGSGGPEMRKWAKKKASVMKKKKATKAKKQIFPDFTKPTEEEMDDLIFRGQQSMHDLGVADAEADRDPTHFSCEAYVLGYTSVRPLFKFKRKGSNLRDRLPFGPSYFSS